MPLLLIHLLVLTFLGFTAWPEMTLWPYLVLKGWLPYRDIAMAHNPLLIFDLAIFYKLFGVSLLGLKLYTWTIILLTDILIYVVANKLTKNRSFALCALIFYLLWQPFFEGNGLWFDLALAPLALLIFYFLWKKEFFWSGIFLGIAILVKQTAVWFIAPVIVQLTLSMWGAHKWRLFVGDLSMLALGSIIPLVFLLLHLLLTNTLSDFYFWAVKFGIFYLPKAPGQVLLPTIKQILALTVPFALILPALFFKKERKLILILLVWFLFASLGVYPRWSLFHFQPALPFLAIISGLVLVEAAGYEFFHPTLSVGNLFSSALARSPGQGKKGGKNVGLSKIVTRRPLVIFIFVLLVISGTIYFQFRFYKLNFRAGDRFFEKETLGMAYWLKQNTKPNEKIFIFNSWDNLYAMSNTLPATRPWVPILPWYLEYPGIQEKIVADLEKNKPELMVFEPYKVAGLGSYQPKQIDKFMKANYTLKEIIGDRFWVMELIK